MNYLIEVNTSGYKSVTKEIKLEAEPFLGEHNKYHYCYEVYVPSSNMYYIGSRSSKDWSSDSYLGTSTHDIYKDDINLSKCVVFKIISFHETRDDAFIEEEHIVDDEFINRIDVYNKVKPNTKFTPRGLATVKFRDNRNNETFSVKVNDPRYLSGELVGVNLGKRHSIETKETLSIIRQNMSKDTKLKMSKSKTGTSHSDETKQKISNKNKNRKHSEISRKNMSDGQKGKTLSEETKRKIKDSFTGYKWVTNGSINIKVKAHELEEYLTNGYRRGWTTKK